MPHLYFVEICIKSKKQKTLLVTHIMYGYYKERFCNVTLEAFALNACAFLCLMTFEFMYVSPGDSLEHQHICQIAKKQLFEMHHYAEVNVRDIKKEQILNIRIDDGSAQDIHQHWIANDYDLYKHIVYTYSYRLHVYIAYIWKIQ